MYVVKTSAEKLARKNVDAKIHVADLSSSCWEGKKPDYLVVLSAAYLAYKSGMAAASGWPLHMLMEKPIAIREIERSNGKLLFPKQAQPCSLWQSVLLILPLENINSKTVNF
jgi:hypothetical protein